MDCSTPRNRLGWRELEEIRGSPGRTVLLFITDRCPVGCAHCSVDSRRDSRTISDFGLFDEIVDWLANHPTFEIVGISGGEPFVERRGLTTAVRRLAAAGKQIVIYTSGVWGVRSKPPLWIREVLSCSSTVFLSTDAFHQHTVPDTTYVNAVRATAEAGAWIVVQVIDVDAMVNRARALLRRALGDGFENFVEVRPVRGLTAGRGANVFTRTAVTPGHAFRACTMLATHTVRYDGRVTACCNENVIMGRGPRQLQGQASNATELDAVSKRLHGDTALRAIGRVGPGALTAHPRYADLADRRFSSICDLCWNILAREDENPRSDRVLELIDGVLLAESAS